MTSTEESVDNLVRLISIIDSSDDAITSMRLDGTITSWNRGAEVLYGYSSVEVIGKPVSIIVPPERQNELVDILERIKQGDRVKHFETLRMRKDGSKVEVSITVSPIFNRSGEIIEASSIARDITERKRITEQRDRIFNFSIDMICIAGFDGYFKELNLSWEKTLGWKNEELCSKPYLDFVHPDDRESTVSAASSLVDGKLVYVFQNRYLCKDGSYKWVSWNSYPLPEEKLIFAIARDVTGQKQLEDSLLETNKRLAESNKELDAFSYSVSHDLRSPLRSMDGFSKILLEDHANRIDDVGKDYLKRIRAASQLMGQLIDDLLKLSRISRSEMRVETVNLSELGGEIAARLRNSSPDRNVEFVIADGLIARGDPHLLKIAIDDLMSNAWKFTSRHPAARIEFGQDQTDGKKAFFVRDDGAGFDMAYIGKMFAPFQRLHSSDEFPGTGIGLATVRRIIDRHGGMIWAEGAVEKGATFYFTLDNGESNRKSHISGDGGSERNGE